jgi:hypothetical protein
MHVLCLQVIEVLRKPEPVQQQQQQSLSNDDDDTELIPGDIDVVMSGVPGGKCTRSEVSYHFQYYTRRALNLKHTYFG